jgi:hypothetical protein
MEVISNLSLSDWLSLVGIFVSLLGFTLSLWQIWKVKSAAESARDAAQNAIEGIRRLDSIIEFSAVATCIDEIKEAARSDDLKRVPALFDKARKSLINARESNGSLSSDDLQSIQKTLTFFTTMELDILKGINDNWGARKQKFVRTLIELSEAINGISSKMKREQS